jgi:hypothetical protein
MLPKDQLITDLVPGTTYVIPEGLIPLPCDGHHRLTAKRGSVIRESGGAASIPS